MPSELAPYLNYGVLGLLVLGIVTGWLWAKPSVDRLLAERDRLIAEKEKAEQQRDAAINIAQERIVPLLTTFVSTTQTLIPLLQEIIHQESHERRR